MASILIADDDDLLGELLRFKLEDAGHSVMVVENGENALECAQSGRFDLVVLDAMMPVRSGFEVLRELSKDPAVSDLPVVMLTSRRGQDDVVNALKAGASDYLTKPFIPDELLVRIESILKGAGARQASRSN